MAGIALALAAAMPAHADCDDLMPSQRPPAARSRTVTPNDLIAIRDVGFPDALYEPTRSPLAVSPDGRRLAFVISRADRVTNSYCRGLVVVDLDGIGRPRIVDRGGEFVPLIGSIRGLVIRPGAPDVVTPAWSPDGRMLAYRKRINGRTEAWVAGADGSGAHSVARLEVDVDDLVWSRDGLRLVLRSRPAFAEHEQALRREGRAGYLYDDRFQPNDSSVPAMTSDIPGVVRVAELKTGVVGAASEADASRLSPDAVPEVRASRVAVSGSGDRAWLASEEDRPFAPVRLRAEIAGRPPVVCEAEACRGAIRSLGWIGDDVVYLRREGWAEGSSVLYRWIPGSAAPTRVYAGLETLHGCVPAATTLVCLAENAAETRRVVSIDLADGAPRTVFDPNPEFRRIRLGTVRRLPLRNSFGLESWADLIFPPNYRGGRIPMVVVQYFSDGFLRGGVGDEYPVHAFAARGIAVLSIQRPTFAGLLDPEAKTGDQQNAANWRGWADRKNLQSTIEAAVAEAVRLGVADSARVGITGLSDGSTSAVWALINSRLFAAASVSSCCYEPGMMNVYGGPRFADQSRYLGTPAIGADDRAYWAPMSLARNAAAIRAPILMQEADREYLFALEAWAALKQAHRPVEMYVYPDEYHNKWQPAHRYAAYLRNLDWFDYWLAGKRDADPTKAEQYRRWDELARLRDTGGAQVAAGAGH